MSQRVLPVVTAAVTSFPWRNIPTLFLEFNNQNKYHYPPAELTDTHAHAHTHTLRQTLWVTFMLAVEADCGGVGVKKARHVVTNAQGNQAAGRK